MGLFSVYKYYCDIMVLSRGHIRTKMCHTWLVSTGGDRVLYDFAITTIFRRISPQCATISCVSYNMWA